MDESEKIPMDWVEGPDETTLWLWTQTPDPLVVTLTSEEWENIKERAVKDTEGDVEEWITRVITADVEQHKKVLSD